MASFLIACPERILRHRSRFLGKFVRYPRQNRVRARLSPSVDRVRWLFVKVLLRNSVVPRDSEFSCTFPCAEALG